MTDAPLDKQALLANMRRERTALDALVASLSAAQLTASGANDGWSVKDHLSHIAAWERMIVAHLRDGSDAEVAGMDAASYAAATLDALNDRLYQLSRYRPIADVIGELAEAHRAILEFIAAMPEQRLAEVYWGDDPSMRSVLEKISGDTFLHYREHAAWIREIAGRPAEAE